jgi:hypothetical protein
MDPTECCEMMGWYVLDIGANEQDSVDHVFHIRSRYEIRDSRGFRVANSIVKCGWCTGIVLRAVAFQSVERTRRPKVFSACEVACEKTKDGEEQVHGRHLHFVWSME